MNTQGGLALRFRAGATGTTLHVQQQTPPLRVIRAFPGVDGSALVHLHNVSGGVLGGDQLTTLVEVESGAQAQLTSTGATRVYRRRAEQPATCQQHQFHVAAGGLLEYLPDPLIPYAGSAYHQQTTITLAADAGLFYWEVVAPGRTARNERFAYDQLRMDLSIKAGKRPIAWERFSLEPTKQSPTSLIRFGPYQYFATFYICRVGLSPQDWRALEDQLANLALSRTRPGEIEWGISTLVAHGLVVRGLAINGRWLSEGLIEFWQQAKMQLYGQAASLPRKIY